AVVDHFIEQASYHWIMDRCICRESDDCQTYPHDLGCIFLGEAVQHISPHLGRRVTKAEALAHARRCREAGLVQLIGRDRLDSIWLGARPFGKLMTICHCCPCCCLFRILPDLRPGIGAGIQRMPGVRVWVGAECAGCGRCTEAVCFVDAIRLVDGQAHISDECRGCGRCVETCPQDAIHLTIEDQGYIQAAIAGIAARVDVDGRPAAGELAGAVALEPHEPPHPN
ncbi:MAG TPA: 4Fe-4S binding protein, partial [Anaerolineaceae bacterium]|nr:4Fe-4S binding protein [Anaerolineaceae bacterium]